MIATSLKQRRRLFVKPSACERRAFSQRLELCPGDLRVRAAAETTVAAGDDVLAPNAPRETRDALRHDLRMLDDVGRVRHHARDQYLACRQLHAVPHGVLVL